MPFTSAAGSVAPSPDRVAEIVAFLRHIGLAVRFDALLLPTVVPGVSIEAGAIVIDRARLECEGDSLHEAGHLAVMTPVERAAANGMLASDPANEMAAIAWSYAAAVRLGLPAERLFHAKGYRGGASAMVAAFESGAEIGVPMLRWYGLAAQPGDGPAYPTMLRWLRD